MIRLTQSIRPKGDSVVPMINVAFLLLVFFLMTAVIVPPDPLDVSPPEAEGRAADGRADVLVVSADGLMALGDARGEAIFGALPDVPLLIRADADLDAATLARILRRLRDEGVSDLKLVALPPG